MLRHITSRHCALALLLTSALPACAGDDKGDTDTDTTATTDATTTTATTTTASTDTDTATTAETTTDTTGTDTDTDTDTGDIDPLCVAPSGVKSGFYVDFSAWEEIDPMAFDVTLKIEAQCTIEALSPGAGALDVALRCTEGDKIDLPIMLSLSDLPGDFAHTLEQDAAVRLQYRWRSEGHHIEPGHWFILHDAAMEHLHMIGVDYDSPGGGTTTPLTLSADASLCANPCGDEPLDCVDTHRVSVRVSGGGESVTVLDSHRDALLANGVTYDVIVPKATRRYCLNCSDSYRLLVSAAPQ
ncbi:MAG: hypothetical protein IPK80_06840 [Nannocystis sp.]|nr:hypothetical protein [Nannocystis sp.]